MTDLASAIDAIPLVASNTERAVRFPSPATNQRVQNLATGGIQRWNGSAWVEDAITLPGSGRTVTTLSAFLANNAPFNPLDYGATSGVDDTATIAATEAGLPAQTGGGATGGGSIEFPEGQFLTSGWTPVVLNMPVRGRGQYTTRIRGTGAGGATIDLISQARLRFSDLSIEGGAKDYALRAALGSASIVTLDNVRLLGGLVNALLLGDTALGPDVSEWLLNNVTVQSEAGTVGPPLKLRGNNTAPIKFSAGHVSTGPVVGVNAVDIDDGAHVSFYDTNILADTAIAAVYARSGTVQFFGGHIEAGALIETLVGDARTDLNTPPHLLLGVTCATPGVLSDVVHNAHRTMMIGGCRFAGNVSIGAGATVIDLGGNSFAAGKGFVVAAGGFLYGAEKGTLYPKVPTATDLTVSEDLSQGGNSLVLANNATATIPSINYGSVRVWELVSGQEAMFEVTNNAIWSMAQSGAIFTNTIGTGSKVNIAPVGVDLKFENKTGAPVSLRIRIVRAG